MCFVDIENISKIISPKLVEESIIRACSFLIKFSFSEKATPFLLLNVKTIWNIAQYFVAFPEKLNFMYSKYLLFTLFRKTLSMYFCSYQIKVNENCFPTPIF